MRYCSPQRPAGPSRTSSASPFHSTGSAELAAWQHLSVSAASALPAARRKANRVRHGRLPAGRPREAPLLQRLDKEMSTVSGRNGDIAGEFSGEAGHRR